MRNRDDETTVRPDHVMHQELYHKHEPVHLVIQPHSKKFIDQVVFYEVSLESSRNTLTLSIGLEQTMVPKECCDAVVALVHQLQLYQGAAKVLMSLSLSQAINDDIEFYVSISAYFIDVLLAFREEVMIYAPRTRSNWWSARLDYHFAMAISKNSLTKEQQAIALKSMKLSWKDFMEKKKRCVLVKRLDATIIHDTFCRDGSNMCGGSPRHLFSVQEMIARATVEHTTGHAAEITKTQQVTTTQLEGGVDESKTSECSNRNDIHSKGTDPSDEDGSIIRIGTNTDLDIATEGRSRPSIHSTESEDNYDIDMVEHPYMVRDDITQLHKSSSHVFLPMNEMNEQHAADGLQGGVIPACDRVENSKESSHSPPKDGGRVKKRIKFEIHPMPVQDVLQTITSAAMPASNDITRALDDQCALSSSSGQHDTGSVVTGPMMAESSPVYGISSEVVEDGPNHEHGDSDGSEHDRETDGSLGEMKPADTEEYVINNCISNSSALRAGTTISSTIYNTPSRTNSPWTDLSGDNLPPAIPQWTNALNMVERSPSRIKVPPGVGTGFRWPDPALFTHTESPVHQARYLVHYFTSRYWLVHVGRRALFRSIYWKEFLDGLSVEKQLKQLSPTSRIYSIMYRGGGIDGSEASQIREQALDAFKADVAEVRNVFNWVNVQYNGRLAKTFEFRGLVFELKDLLNIPPCIIPQIIWELCENNFADDVLWLDALFRRGHDSTDVYGSPRTEEVQKLCGMQEMNTLMPLVRSSFGSERWNKRVKHVEAFRQLMSTWPNFPDYLKAPVPTQNEYSFEERELHVFTFYAQTHFDYIGRLPVVPRRLPDMGPLWVYNVYRKRL